MSEQQSNFDLAELTKMYNFKGKTVAITGGAGVLGSDIVYALTGCGAEVAILDIVSELHPATIERLGERISRSPCSSAMCWIARALQRRPRT